MQAGGYVVNVYVRPEDYEDLLAFNHQGIPYAEIMRLGLEELRRRQSKDSEASLLTEKPQPKASRPPASSPKKQTVEKASDRQMFLESDRQMFLENVRGLSTTQARAVALYEKGIKVADIGKQLGMGENAVYKDIQRAREKLKSYGEKIERRSKAKPR